mgnify:FL=1
MTPNAINAIQHSQTLKTSQEEKLQDAANKLEATFLAEMLKTAGFGETPDTFGGGTGEDQFSSFLVQAQAEKIVEAGGIGLAEHIFDALKESINGTS